MKLTQEHLAPYLLTGLLFERKNYKYERFVEISPYIFLPDGEIENLIPILRPMNQLLNDQWYYIWEKEIDTESLEVLLEEPYDTEFFQNCKFSYSTMKQLFKNHFDVFGLINEGLATEKLL